ncbi:MAG: helix-turn-helix transcriptional regulator, partial [Lentisphaerae bacterium]|nr:helix-turn-helix transcriptional regulator [Lentisphaerota bacterium]
TAPLKIPGRGSGDRISKGMHFHLEPEMFVQISGYTEFTFPKDRFKLMPGEICLIPPKVGHSEKAFPCNGFTFYNLVIMPRASRTSIHVANSAKGRPRLFKGIACETAINTSRLIRYMEDLCDLADDKADADSEELSLSILQSVVLLILSVMRNKGRIDEGGRAALCRTIVAGSITDPSLNVKKIAVLIKCSPDYLSHAFHIETGMKLTEYINQQRTDMSKELLESSLLSVKEIAWACGYSDPGYFTRVFRKRMDISPRAYRRNL